MRMGLKRCIAWMIGLAVFLSTGQLDIVAAERNDLIWPAPGAINISKTAVPVEGSKNEWEIQLKVDGKNKKIKQKTDVVLVLDTSGSMKESVGIQLRCNKEEHYHSPIRCGRYYDGWGWRWRWACGLEQHIHESGRCYDNITRANMVENSANKFVDQLLSVEEGSANIQLAIASFNGDYTGHPYYSDTGSVVQGFTNNKDTLKTGISRTLANPQGGTNYADGFKAAREYLQKHQDKTNPHHQMIIFLSDGMPTFPGLGNELTHESINAAYYESSLIKETSDVKIYTIGVGIEKNTRHYYRKWDGYYRCQGYCGYADDADTILRNCATSEKHFYWAEDTTTALDNMMTSIAREIVYGAKAAKITDPMGQEFDLVVKDKFGRVKWEVRKDTKLEDLDVVISQGAISYDKVKDTLHWDIGKVSEGTPAIMRYKVKMLDSVSDSTKAYETNGNTVLGYIDAYGDYTTKSSGKGDFDIPRVTPSKGNIKVIYYTVDKVNNQWVPVNRDGVVIKEGKPEFAYEIKKFFWEDKEVLDFKEYNLTPEKEVKKDGITYVPAYEIIRDENLKVTLNAGDSNKIVYIPYHPELDSKECNCSIVLAEFIGRIKDLEEGALTNEVIKENLIGSIAYKVKLGKTEFERELASYELKLLLEKYGNELIGKEGYKAYGTLVKEANQDELKQYININGKGIVGIRRILQTLGIPTSTKTLESIYEQLNHEHTNKVRACTHEKICGRPPEDVKNGTIVYEDMHLQVQDNHVKECVCRYEHLKTLVQSRLEGTIIQDNQGSQDKSTVKNYIMADGLSFFEFKFFYTGQASAALNLDITADNNRVEGIAPEFTASTPIIKVFDASGKAISVESSPTISSELNKISNINKINITMNFEDKVLNPDTEYTVRVYFNTQLKDIDYSDYKVYMEKTKTYQNMKVRLMDKKNTTLLSEQNFKIVYKSLKNIS